MAITSKPTTVSSARAQVSIDSFKNQRVYMTLASNASAQSVYVGGSTVDSGSNAGYLLYNAANATTLATASFDVPMGEKLFVHGTGTVYVTVIPMAR